MLIHGGIFFVWLGLLMKFCLGLNDFFWIIIFFSWLALWINFQVWSFFVDYAQLNSRWEEYAYIMIKLFFFFGLNLVHVYF